MLVLTRKIGEEIVIGDDVCIKVIDVRQRQVGFEIRAQGSVRIDRLESQGLRVRADSSPAVSQDEKKGYPQAIGGCREPKSRQ
jgi:carbon storage regulator CsrA